MGAEVYEKLRQHLDRLPLGAPKTVEGVEIELLKRLFTEEEALSLQRKEGRVPPPARDMGGLLMQIAREKGKI